MEPLSRAMLSLEGLSVGDAYGQAGGRDAPWPTTDDTEMASAVVEVLDECGRILPDRLAAAFLRRWRLDPHRGYAAGARELLERLDAGEGWEAAAAGLFGGRGSFGNGAAMRAAPVGAFFAEDPARVADEALLSAMPTHAHPEGRSGAVAVALAAAAVWRGEPIFEAVLAGTPEGVVSRNVESAAALGPGAPVEVAALRLGAGARVSAQDTVGFALWCAARHLHDYGAAVRAAVSSGGDADTIAAIVGGIVALAVGLEGIPPIWREAREPLRTRP